MAFILDMSSGKKYRSQASDCPIQRTAKAQLPDAAGDVDDPTLQLATVEASASAQQPASALPGFAIDSLRKSIED